MGGPEASQYRRGELRETGVQRKNVFASLEEEKLPLNLLGTVAGLRIKLT